MPIENFCTSFPGVEEVLARPLPEFTGSQMTSLALHEQSAEAFLHVGIQLVEAHVGVSRDQLGSLQACCDQAPAASLTNT
jgi:hypothetical protein